MPEPFLRISTDTKKITDLQRKMENFPPIAIQAGLKATNDYLNTDEFKESMYAPKASPGTPFDWSSDKQRRAFFATDGFGGGIPTVRTYALAQDGAFSVNEASLWIEYSNTAPYSKYVIHPTFQIVGHIHRGWKPVNKFVVAKSGEIAKVFESAAVAAWKSLTGDSYKYVRSKAGK
jgi:hypothetical protein